MKIVDYKSGAWRLLEQASHFFTNIHCRDGYSDPNLLLELSPRETARYRAEGRAYLDIFAKRIAYSGALYSRRNQPEAVRKRAQAAVKRWQIEQGFENT